MNTNIILLCVEDSRLPDTSEKNLYKELSSRHPWADVGSPRTMFLKSYYSGGHWYYIITEKNRPRFVCSTSHIENAILLPNCV